VADVVAGEPDEDVADDAPPVDDELEELLPRLLLLHATPTSAAAHPIADLVMMIPPFRLQGYSTTDPTGT